MSTQAGSFGLLLHACSDHNALHTRTVLEKVPKKGASPVIVFHVIHKVHAMSKMRVCLRSALRAIQSGSSLWQTSPSSPLTLGSGRLPASSTSWAFGLAWCPACPTSRAMPRRTWRLAYPRLRGHTSLPGPECFESALPPVDS